MLRLPRLLSALLALMLATPAMAVDSTSTFLQLLLMDTGLHNNDWGTQTNNNLLKLEAAISGYTPKSLTGGSYSLTADEARAAVLIFAGSLASNEIITVPSSPKIWIVSNQMTLNGFALSMKTAAGSAVTVPPNSTSTVLYWCDGTNIFAVGDQSGSISSALALASAALARTGGTMTGDLILSSSSPPNSLSAAPKTYVDAVNTTATAANSAAAAAQTTANNALPKAGGTMSGAIAMGGSKVTGLGTPTTGTDAATKAYVDAIPKLFAKVAVQYDGTTLGGAYNVSSTSTSGGVVTVNFTTAATSAYSYTCTATATGGGSELPAHLAGRGSTSFIQMYVTQASGALASANLDLLCFQ